MTDGIYTPCKHGWFPRDCFTCHPSQHEDLEAKLDRLSARVTLLEATVEDLREAQRWQARADD